MLNLKNEVVRMLAPAEHRANTLDEQSNVDTVLCNVVCQLDTGNDTKPEREEDASESKRFPATKFKEIILNESMGMHLQSTCVTNCTKYEACTRA